MTAGIHPIRRWCAALIAAAAMTLAPSADAQQTPAGAPDSVPGLVGVGLFQRSWTGTVLDPDIRAVPGRDCPATPTEWYRWLWPPIDLPNIDQVWTAVFPSEPITNLIAVRACTYQGQDYIYEFLRDEAGVLRWRTINVSVSPYRLYPVGGFPPG
jgi:hypothetical protein